MSISILQHNSAHASGVTECDVSFGGTNTAHKALIVFVGWKGSTDEPTLTCEDNMPNLYSTWAAAPIFQGSHSVLKAFYCSNGRPGSGCTIKVKSGSDMGNFVVAACEVDQVAGNIFGSNPERESTSGAGQTALDVDSGVQAAADLFQLVCGYGEPNNSTHAATTRGTFAGGSMTPIDMESSSIGSLGTFWQEYPNSLGGGKTGAHYIFDSSPTTSAQVSQIIFTAGAASPADYALTSVTFTPNGGEFSSHPTVALSLPLTGMTIHYTTDGSTPTAASPIYSAPIVVSGPTTVIQAYAVDPSGFWNDGPVSSATYDIFTGTVLNPNNIIDGDDSTYAELDCNGSTGDVVVVSVDTMGGVTGAPGTLNVDFEVTQNDLIAPSQTLPAWKVSGKIGGSETVLASGTPGAGPVARNVVTLSVSPGTAASQLSAKIAAICQNAGSSGGVKVRVYAAYLELT